MTEDIRQTKQYTLYRGHHQTANLYSVIQRPTYEKSLGYSETWLTELQKDELMKMDDMEFDKACSKIDFK